MYIGLMILGRQKYKTAEPLVPEPSAFKFEMADEKVKSQKSRGISQIPRRRD